VYFDLHHGGFVCDDMLKGHATNVIARSLLIGSATATKCHLTSLLKWKLILT